MSPRHTGKLVASVLGERCEFDGNQWQTENETLRRLLQDKTATAPTTHYTIRELAVSILNRLGLLEASETLSSLGCEPTRVR